MTGDRKTFIAINATPHGAGSPLARGTLQRDLRDIVARAAADARLPFDEWIGHGQGDGVLFAAPVEFEPRYIDDFVPFVTVHVGHRNDDSVSGDRLRARIALDQGPADESAKGIAGGRPILACRLRDAQATKNALETGGSDVVLVLSDQLFRNNVARERTRVTIAEFSRMVIDEPDLRADAWLWLSQCTGHGNPGN